jgi:hypothetical protein
LAHEMSQLPLLTPFKRTKHDNNHDSENVRASLQRDPFVTWHQIHSLVVDGTVKAFVE